MGKTLRKEKDILVRRNEILDAAERLYEKESFEAVTMDKIASEAEFTKQTLYSYFKGKEELMAAVYVRAAKFINTAFESNLRVGESISGYERLVAIRDVFMEIAGTKPLYIRMMALFQLKDLSDFMNLGVYNEIMMESARQGSIITGCIEKGVADGSISADVDIQSGALFLNALITGALCITVFNEQYIKQELKADPLELLKGILGFSLRAFKNNI